MLYQHYENYGPLYLSKKLKRSVRSVRHKISRLKINPGNWRDRISKNSKRVNASYFANEWNDEMAWLVGYIHADGYVVNSQRRYAIRFECHLKDKELIYFARKILKSKHKVSFKKEYLDKNGKKHGPSIRCFISNKILVKDLIDKTGFCGGKSYIDFKIPESLPHNLLPHYLRGYFDGDGWASPNDRNIGFVGTNDFLHQINDILKSIGMKSRPVERNGYHTETNINKKIRWYTLKDWKLLFEFLYPPKCYPYLKRKHKLISKELEKFGLIDRTH